MMTWIWLAVSVLSQTMGDLLSAKGMAQHAELSDFSAGAWVRVMRYIVTHRLVVAGVALNAVAFFSFMALLTVANLSMAVPATASSYLLKTALAEWYLREKVSAARWAGALLVAAGVWLVTT